MATIYVEKDKAEAFRLVNTSGADLAINQFTVLGGRCLKACSAIVSTATGGFEDLRDKVFRASTFVSGEATFAAGNAAVYWKPSTGEFSNTSTATYYLVGYTAEPIASGVLKVIGCDPLLISA